MVLDELRLPAIYSSYRSKIKLMKFPMYLEDGQIEQLEYEVLSKDFYIYLTRFFNHWCEETNNFASMVMRKNK